MNSPEAPLPTRQVIADELDLSFIAARVAKHARFPIPADMAAHFSHELCAALRYHHHDDLQGGPDELMTLGRLESIIESFAADNGFFDNTGPVTTYEAQLIDQQGLLPLFRTWLHEEQGEPSLRDLMNMLYTDWETAAARALTDWIRHYYLADEQ